MINVTQDLARRVYWCFPESIISLNSISQSIFVIETCFLCGMRILDELRASDGWIIFIVTVKYNLFDLKMKII
jgi:hypothetical protein